MRAFYHLPGLFEFYELYRAFLPLYREHREYFYDWCGIGSIYGAPADCLWGGGRVGFGDAKPEDAAALIVQLCAERLPRNMGIRPEEIQTLTPMRKGTTGVFGLNEALQNALNPPAKEKKEKKREKRVIKCT